MQPKPSVKTFSLMFPVSALHRICQAVVRFRGKLRLAGKPCSTIIEGILCDSMLTPIFVGLHFSIRSTVTFSRPGMFSASIPESIRPSRMSPFE